MKKHQKASKSIKKHISVNPMLYLCNAFQKQRSFEPDTKVIRRVAEEINKQNTFERQIKLPSVQQKVKLTEVYEEIKSQRHLSLSPTPFAKHPFAQEQ